jgi:hypothetical protein
MKDMIILRETDKNKVIGSYTPVKFSSVPQNNFYYNLKDPSG